MTTVRTGLRFIEFLSLQLGKVTQVLLGILKEQINKAGHEHHDQGKPAAGREKQEIELKKARTALERWKGDMSVSGFSGWGLSPQDAQPSRLLVL